MERFDSIYLFTTENIAGYMHDLNLTGQKVITVTGSTDHLINIALRGSNNITTFDLNPLTEKYMDLKLSAIKTLSFKEFLEFLLYDTDNSLAFDIISNLEMRETSKTFWLQKLSELENNGRLLRDSNLFNKKYYNPVSKTWQNLYLNEQSYKTTQERLKDVNISFNHSSLEKLQLNEEYDYMFLSNISDYIGMIYGKEGLIKYRELMDCFLKKVKIIYMAYLYDIENSNPRSEIDDLNKVSQVFKNYEIKRFKSALETKEKCEDGVIILRR